MDILKQTKFLLALTIAKTTAIGLKLFSKPATSLPGMLALKIDKDFLSNTTSSCQKSIITVTGTNGKTTTSGLIAEILKKKEDSVLHNNKGANMPQGIATSLALNITPYKKFDYFVLENDEAYLNKIYDQINADYLVVTNLFLDQMDRYCETQKTASLIKKAIDKNPNLTLLLNADDPMLKTLYTKKTLTFGFENIEVINKKENGKMNNEIYCSCGGKLSYTKHFYDNIGHYSCTCGFRRKEPDFNASAKIYQAKTEITVKYQTKTYNLTTKLSGIYNAYNVLAAIAISIMTGHSEQNIQNALNQFKPAFGRTDKIFINGKEILIQLIKNPTGTNEAINAVLSSNNKSNLLIAINDEYADGRDVSWLWATNFEALNKFGGKIIVSGKRASDMALRLKYIGLKTENIIIEENIELALKTSLKNTKTNHTLHILQTYTALSSIQKILKKL